MSIRSRDRCAALSVVNGKLVSCGRPATYTVTVSERPGAHLHQETVDTYCGEQGRCDEHAQKFLAEGDWIQSPYLSFEIRPKETRA